MSKTQFMLFMAPSIVIASILIIFGVIPVELTGKYIIGNYTYTFIDKCDINRKGGCSGYTHENGEIFIVTNKGLISQYDTCIHEKLHNILTYEHNVTFFDDETYSYDNDYEELLIEKMTMLPSYDEDCIELFKKTFEKG